jgi:hypothetical protein
MHRRASVAALAAAALVACAVAPTGAAAQVAPPTASVFFAQEAATPGADVGLGVTVANPNAGLALTGVGVSVGLPAGVVISTPSNLATTCDGSVTAADGGTAIALSGATLAAAGDEVASSCSVLVDVVMPGPGVVTVSSGPPTSNESGAGSASDAASLRVLALPTVAEAFDESSISVGETARVTYTLANPNGSTRLYNVAFDDALPAGLAVAPAANVASTCPVDGVSAAPGATTISLLGVQLEGGATCAFSVDVGGVAATIAPNATGPLSFGYDAGGGDLRSATAPGASATLVVVAPPSLTLAFGAPSIAAGASTTLAFTVANTNPALALSGVGFSAALPAGLVVASPAGLSGACGAATITAAVGSGSIALAGAALGSSATCAFSVAVIAQSVGAKTVTTSLVSSSEAGSGPAAAASLLVLAAPVTPVAPPPPLPPPPPPAAPRLPGNAFKVTHARAAADGTVRFDVTVAGRGEVFVLETLGASAERVRTPGPSRFTIARKTVRTLKAGKLPVKVTPNPRGKRAIRRAARAPRLNHWVSFRPTGGRAGTAVRKTLVVRRR